MTSATFVQTAARTDARRSAARWIRRALIYDLFGVRGLTLLRFGWTGLFVVLLTLWSAVANLVVKEGFHPSFGTLVGYFWPFILQWGTLIVPSMIAVSVADGLPLEGVRRVLVIIAALTLAALLDTALHHECSAKCASLPAWRQVSDFVLDVWGRVGLTGTMAATYFYRRKDQSIAAALHASEMARVDTERDRLQSTLQAMQARIEPTFLQDVLRDVAALYESDRNAGGRLLDLLILYLRMALPYMNGADATIEREAGLLRTYVEIVALRSHGELAVDFSVDPTLAAARCPPMTLVPLVATIAQTRAALGSIKFHARGVDQRIRMGITAKGAISHAIAKSPALREVRERLVALYGERASFVVDRPEKDALQLILEIPHERADRSPR
ncbi:MAG TPA: histidine kinase [Casimicrobiaceae bacterium]|jgi:hypothetical protein